MRLLYLALAACSSAPTSMTMMMDAPPERPPPAQTSPGTPTGTAATQMIGPDGGTVTSADGRLDVAIPPGAFADPTAVTIQPITNLLPNGLGVAYRLSPEGTTFAAPATLTFHIGDPANLAASFVATQHGDGTWWSQPMQAHHDAASTVTLPAPHFSDWALAQTLLVLPHETRVRVGGSVDYSAVVVVPEKDGDELASPTGGESEVSTAQVLTDQIAGTHEWSVNATPGGAPDIGLITDGGAIATYAAPNNPPDPSTVNVSLAVESGTMHVIATAAATIYAQEIWSGTSDVTSVDGSTVHADVTFVEDLASSTGTKVRLDVMSGTAHVTPVPPQNCTMTVAPDTMTIGTHDGQMVVEYDLGTGPDNPHVTGQGTTVWLATYTTMCPNGTGSMQAGLSAPWWPSPPGMPPTNDADNGVLDVAVSSQLASGTIHLVRQR